MKNSDKNFFIDFDENLLLETFEFLRINLFYSDHFVIKYVNSELLNDIDNLIIRIFSLKEFNLHYRNIQRLMKIAKDIYLLLGIINYDSEFINKVILKFSNKIKEIKNGSIKLEKIKSN